MSRGFSTPYGSYKDIPNAILGVWGDDESNDSCSGTIHVLFPDLGLDSQRPTHLSEEELKTLYEEGLRPCIAETLPEAALDWPAEYNYGPHNTPGAGGDDSHAGTSALRFVMVPSASLANFASNLRAHLQSNKVEWAKGLFFFYRVCGIKKATQHPKTKKAAGSALIKVLERAQIPLKATDQGSWWIDIGLEFRSDQGRFLQWTTASHECLVQEVLGVSMATATRMTTLGRDGYSRDIPCHLSENSGCRLEAKIRHQHNGPFFSVYLELTTTEMSKAPRPILTIPEAMDRHRQPPQSVIDLFNVFHRQRASQNLLDSNVARIELRVPLKYAKESNQRR
jgi:hypothetical protein